MLIVLIILVIMNYRVTGLSNADEFIPERLRIIGPDFIRYNFDGSNLSIPIILDGQKATVILIITTREIARYVQPHRSGYLGWHYVNHIDTCIYVSPPYEFEPGQHIIEWEGKTSGFENLTYYLWAYDSTTPKQLVSKYVQVNRGIGMIETYGDDGFPLAYPVFYSTPDVYHTGEEPVEIIRQKWVIGSDPYESDFLETTSYPGWIDQ